MGQFSDNLFRKGRIPNDYRSNVHRLRPAEPKPLNPDPAKIGKRGGFCQRTACRRPGANNWHTGRHEYYCDTCANEINRACRDDAMRMYGVPFLIVNPAHISDEDRAKLAARNVNVPEA